MSEKVLAKAEVDFRTPCARNDTIAGRAMAAKGGAGGRPCVPENLGQWLRFDELRLPRSANPSALRTIAASQGIGRNTAGRCAAKFAGR